MKAVYQIKNLVNGKMYIGSSDDVTTRKHRHFSELRNNIHNNVYLQNAWNYYGEHNFEFSILEYININSDRDGLYKIEQDYMDKAQCYNRKIGYNIYKTAKGVGSGKDNPMYGRKLTEKHKERIMEGLKNRVYPKGENHPLYKRPRSADVKAKISKANTGVPLSSEHKMKLSQSHLGKKASEETKTRMSISQKRRNLKKGTPIHRFDINRVYLNTYPNISEAYRDLGKGANSGGINNHLAGRSSHAYGYLWSKNIKQCVELI